MDSNTLDDLEEQRSKTFAEYTELVGDVSCCGHVDLQVSFLEDALAGIYVYTRNRTKGEMSAREVHDLWKKTVEICDFFIDHVRMLAQRTQCRVNFDGLLDTRLKADEKSRFHAGCE